MWLEKEGQFCEGPVTARSPAYKGGLQASSVGGEQAHSPETSQGELEKSLCPGSNLSTAAHEASMSGTHSRT